MQMTVMTPPSLNNELHYLNKEDRLLRWLLVKHRDIKFGFDLLGEDDDGKYELSKFRSNLYEDNEYEDDDDDTMTRSIIPMKPRETKSRKLMNFTLCSHPFSSISSAVIDSSYHLNEHDIVRQKLCGVSWPTILWCMFFVALKLVMLNHFLRMI